MTAEAETSNATRELARECADLLAEAENVVAGLKGVIYRSPGAGPIGGVGAQVRHLIEFYSAFLGGLEEQRVDYDRRARDARIETDPARAGEALAELQARLGRESWPAGTIEIRMDEDSERFVPSSVERELRFLHTHTIHHFAIIRLLLEECGVRVAPGFGMAPSTLLHRDRIARGNDHGHE
jgi:uncharacterized damage-inducible protein DinB